MKKYTLLTILNVLIMIFAVQSVNSACVWVIHQPKVPAELAKFKNRTVLSK